MSNYSAAICACGEPTFGHRDSCPECRRLQERQRAIQCRGPRSGVDEPADNVRFGSQKGRPHNKVLDTDPIAGVGESLLILDKWLKEGVRV